MTVPIPAPDRVDPPFTGSDEHAWYEAWLDHHRDTLLWKCSGLDGEQLCRRSVPTTTMTLLGLVRHMTEVERDWFRNDLDRQGVAKPYSSPERRNDEFDAVDPARAAQDVEAYRAEIVAVKEAAARHGLDETFDEPRYGPISLRWLYLHMLEEYARHNGHADLLREAIDGETGE